MVVLVGQNTTSGSPANATPWLPLLESQRLSGYYSPMHPNPSPFSVHSYWVGCCQWESNPQPDLYHLWLTSKCYSLATPPRVPEAVSGNRTPNLTFNTSGSPADATSNMDVTPSLFKFLVKMPSNSSFVAKDIVRFK
ncbi:hypothetical protein DEO72_LG10g2830 [Vigna unguiculata]|uniref:Uncharacterized protein n=1 Tax=Vigna unguiculata TaxID=3917 RepID=A0A4D6NI25_VIGUN|nr:hypothetical protein DEO72_LG10g2830 [Vigna unguiculata]